MLRLILSLPLELQDLEEARTVLQTDPEVFIPSTRPRFSPLFSNRVNSNSSKTKRQIPTIRHCCSPASRQILRINAIETDHLHLRTWHPVEISKSTGQLLTHIVTPQHQHPSKTLIHRVLVRLINITKPIPPPRQVAWPLR